MRRQSAQEYPTRLIRHDLAIIRAEAAKIFRRRSDFLTVLIGFPILAMAFHGWTASLPQDAREATSFLIAFLFGLSACNLTRNRLAYHRGHGALSAYAQSLGGKAALTLAITASLGLSLFALQAASSSPAWLGSLICALAGAIFGIGFRALYRSARRYVLPKFLPLFSRSQTRRGSLWLLATTGAICGLGCGLALHGDAMGTAIICLLGLGAFALLATVAFDTVSFMRFNGIKTGHMIAWHLKFATVFFLFLSLGLTGALDLGNAAIALAMLLLIALIVTTRVLAYQCFGKRLADWFVSILAAVVSLFAFTFPPIAPFVLILGVGMLLRNSASRKWLIE
ncbi:hypothetical protein LCM19_01310 [Qipengyuania flava]|nr:hypothetical protein [Qipengyuania flava]